MTGSEKLQLIQAIINRMYEFNYMEPEKIIAGLDIIDLIVSFEFEEEGRVPKIDQ